MESGTTSQQVDTWIILNIVMAAGSTVTVAGTKSIHRVRGIMTDMDGGIRITDGIQGISISGSMEFVITLTDRVMFRSLTRIKVGLKEGHKTRSKYKY